MRFKSLCIRPIDVFLVVSLGITSLFLIGNILTEGALFEKCVLSSTFLFSDYFYHIAGSSDTSVMYSYGDPYSFPPFAYFMYSLLWSLNPYTDNESILNWQNYRQADNAMVVFVVYSMLCMMLLIYCIRQYFRGGGGRRKNMGFSFRRRCCYRTPLCAHPYSGVMLLS